MHSYAIIVLGLRHLDDLVFSVALTMKPAEEDLCARHLSLDLVATDAVIFTALEGGLWTHEETTITSCSPAIEVSAEALGCKDGSAAMFSFVSVSEKAGACLFCGSPICRPKVMAPPFPTHPLPFTLCKTHTHTRTYPPARTRRHWAGRRLW